MTMSVDNHPERTQAAIPEPSELDRVRQTQSHLPTTIDYATIPEIVERARVRLQPEVWDYAFGGAETETTLRRNRQSLDSLAWNTRILRGIANRTPKTTFLGHELSLPVMVAPVGGLFRMHAGGTLTAALVTERFNTAT